MAAMEVAEVWHSARVRADAVQDARGFLAVDRKIRDLSEQYKDK
jgi:hypothetical protein